jgi:hypothetical protein
VRKVITRFCRSFRTVLGILLRPGDMLTLIPLQPVGLAKDWLISVHYNSDPHCRELFYAPRIVLRAFHVIIPHIIRCLYIFCTKLLTNKCSFN